MSEEQFLALVTADQPPPPAYFGYDADLNRRVHEPFHETAARTLTWPEAKAAIAGGAVLLDAREATDFSAGHLRGALSIPLDGRFAETAGMLLRPDDEVVVVAPRGHEVEAVTRLARIGFDHVLGHLPAVESVLLTADPADLGRASRLTPLELDEVLGGGAVTVVDVRNAGELEEGRVPHSVHVPLAELRGRLDEIPRDRPVVAYCAGGWRSNVAASFLRTQGYDDVSDVLGGYSGWAAVHAAPAST